MFGTADLPNGIRLRMTRASDNTTERRIHDANRPELQLLQGGADYIQSILDMQLRARDAEYARRFANALYYMIEKSGDTIGRLVLDFGADGIRIVDLAVLPAFHRQGIGTTVIGAMQRVAATLPAPVILSVRLDNTDAIRLYVSMGFVADGPTEASRLHFQMRWSPPPPA
ncbi:GNAT family N-acetyltransferase [Solimonas sp. K1W22B-7]|uniref:GNAT family N-acetyltransferase n=1 Tax=Solimonas sp. K1W22B-7 TaxID=2303331 RepID=UPI000E3365F2|nr:GNAT family N-acetyltransferase [Solimonas sp. K1W22B-7]AXQ29315.1 GNAT family N-acetyltransferase [Solimonas sp. K1W22B-7]